MMPAGHVTLMEAAALAGLGRNAAYTRVLDGRWPAVRGPKAVYYIHREHLLTAIRLEREETERELTNEGLPTPERVVRELGEVMGQIEQIALRDPAGWMLAQGRVRALRRRVTQLTDHVQRILIERARIATKGPVHETAAPAADRAA